MKMKNKSHWYDINRPKPRYSKYEMCLNMTMLICIEQDISNVWSSVDEKVKQHLKLGWKKRCL